MTVDEYIDSFNGDTKKILEEIRKIIKSVIPNAQELISYGMPTYKIKKNIVHFAAFKKHIGFYPNPSGVTAFTDRLMEYKTSKGAIQFPLDRPIPYNLIKEITEFRLKEVLQ